MSGIQKVKKVVCEKVEQSSVKGASVGSGENGVAFSYVMSSASGTQEIRQGVCKEQARSAVLALAVQVLLVQTRPICGERQRGREMIAAHLCETADVGFSEAESEWLEVEANSASSVTTAQVRPSLLGEVGGSGGHDTPGLDKE